LDSLGTVKGLGTPGQVAYWATGDSLTSNNNFLWDTTNFTLTVGDGSSNQHVVVNGTADATGTEAITDPVWDVAVTGDIAATGIIKSGAGVTIDGVNIPHMVSADQPLTITTSTGTVTLSTTDGSGIVQIADPTSSSDNISIGQNNSVTGGNGATAIGNADTATGSSTLAEGNSVKAGGSNSVAMGQANDAEGYASGVIGQNDTATGNEAMAFGQNLTATGANSIVLGQSATANNPNSFVFGDGSARAFDNASNQFIAQATGGVTFYTNSAQTQFMNYNNSGVLTNNTSNPIFAGGSDGGAGGGINWAVDNQGYALSITNNHNVNGHPGEGLGILVADQTSSNWALNVTNTSGQLFGVRGDGLVTVGGPFSINGNLSMNGNQINGVSSLDNSNNGVTINDALTVIGNYTLEGSSQADIRVGHHQLHDVDSIDNSGFSVTLNDNFIVTDDETVDGSLTVNGSTTLSGLSVNGNMDMNGNQINNVSQLDNGGSGVTVNDNLTVNSNLTVNGTTSLVGVNMTGNLNMGNNQINNVSSLDNGGSPIIINASPSDVQLSAGHLDLNGAKLWDNSTGTVTLGSNLDLNGNTLVHGATTLVDASDNATFASVNATSGTLQTNGTTRIDNSGNATVQAMSVATNSTAANPYNVAAGDYLISETGGGSTVNLPAANSANGRMLVIYNNSGGAVAVAPNGGDTISGGAGNYNLAAAGNSVTLISDGASNWVIMGSH
jgi:hypothetical protein